MLTTNTQTQSDLQVALWLARTAQEAIAATPVGEAPPASVSHALALIAERVEIAANDLDVTAGMKQRP